MDIKIQQWIEKQNLENQLKIEKIREWTLSLSPYFSEKFRYQTLFFDHKSILLYLSVNPKSELYAGFVQGHLMDNSEGHLEGDHNKQIRHFYFREMTKETEENYRCLVLEAIDLEKEMLKLKKRK
ncbi:MAG: hypothetical protein K1X56_08880 [Flavobacteriales bacterium]|nr:hypothetical protein [Flavobacteriales bacterium]